MKFSYNWLQSFFDKEFPKPEELAELLTMHSFEVEEVIKRGDDYILDIDILPNRASDCLSHLGVARECAALLNYKLQPTRLRQGFGGQASSKQNSKLKTQNLKLLSVTIQDESLCPRYSAYVMEGVKITESPDWIKERLAAMEQKTINNVVDITNYVMWELGQPLHAFDLDKIKDRKMNTRLSKGGEKLETLDGATHDLGDDAVVIEDGERIIDLAGIKGGANSQIDENTKRVIFQAAIFDPARIRGTSQKLGIRTDAAVRYMHGFDPNLPPQALERTIEILSETNPEAKIVQKIDIYPELIKPKKISLDVNYVNKLLGTYLSMREMKQILERLNFTVEEENKLRITDYVLRITIPTYRLDINIPEDLVEEIGRVYGYENISAEPPRGILVAPRRNEQVFWRNMARQILVGFGFSEVYNYSLVSFTQLIELLNPISEEFKYLRGSLTYGMLKSISTNQKFFETVQIFEFGKIFRMSEINGEVVEEERCALAIYDKSGKSESGGFYLLKGYVDELLRRLGITDFHYDTKSFEDQEKNTIGQLHPGKRACVVLGDEKVGILGESHPYDCAKLGIGGRVYKAELYFEKIQAAAEEEQIYQTPSKYPEVVRDIALLVPREVMVEEVLNVIETVGGPLLRDTDLFDIYEGENLPEGRKNLAFHLLFQSDERTLTAQEVDEIMSKITKALEEKLWEVR